MRKLILCRLKITTRFLSDMNFFFNKQITSKQLYNTHHFKTGIDENLRFILKQFAFRMLEQSITR